MPLGGVGRGGEYKGWWICLTLLSLFDLLAFFPLPDDPLATGVRGLPTLGIETGRLDDGEETSPLRTSTRASMASTEETHGPRTTTSVEELGEGVTGAEGSFDCGVSFTESEEDDEESRELAERRFVRVPLTF